MGQESHIEALSSPIPAPEFSREVRPSMAIYVIVVIFSLHMAIILLVTIDKSSYLSVIETGPEGV